MPQRSSRSTLLVVLGIAFLAVVWYLQRGTAPATPPPQAALARSPAEARHDLARDEAAGGHTLARHVGRSDRELAQRLEREPGVAAASSFDDRATAERVVSETLRRERRRIEAWLARADGANLALDYRGTPGAPVGRTLLRGEATPHPAFGARVVLRKRDGSYFVLTAYPQEER